MKRISTLTALCLLLPILFFSCSDSGPTAPGENGEEQETTTFEIDININPDDAGTITPSAQGEYEDGETVEFEALPEDEYIFAGWSGDIDSNDNPLSITVSDDLSLTANFELKTYDLTINIEGEGAVSETIIQSKTSEYEHGTVVELTADPANGWHFEEWRGDLPGSENPIEVTIDEPMEVTAIFDAVMYEIFMEDPENGSVEITPDQETFVAGTEVEIEALPDEGYNFVEWKGDVESTENPLNITINSDLGLVPVFEEEVETFTLTVEEPEGGSINYIPLEDEYESGTEIELNAVSDEGYEFSQWTGDISSTDNPFTLEIDRDMVVSAEFEEASANLFYLDDNGVTVMCPDAELGDEGTVDRIVYTKRTADQITPDNAETTCTSDIEDMSFLFDGERDFNRDISHWDVSSVTDMSFMFRNSRSFDQDLAYWDVGNVTNMFYMFWDAEEFNHDINSWDVSSVTDMRAMFAGAVSFNQDLNSWDVSSVTNMEGTFSAAFEFNGDITGWDVSNVTTMSSMFSQASVFNQDIGGWDVSNVTDMSWMFSGAYLFNQNLNSWDVSGVTNMNAMFEYTTAFDQNLNDWDVSSVTTMQRMFHNAIAFNGMIGGWDVSNVTDMDWMFRDAEQFTGGIGSWDVGNVTRMWAMFRGATSFNGSLNSWDVSSVTSMRDMFREAESFNREINTWNTGSVEDMFSMFREAVSFNRDIRNWDVTNVSEASMRSMFEDAEDFNQNISGWCVDHIPNEPSDFATGSNLDRDNKPDWGNCP